MSRTETSRARSRWGIGFIVIVTACSMAAQARRDARLRAELDAHQFQQPLSKVWPAALRLVADRGYQLVGRDRLVGGELPAGRFKRLTAGGFETGRRRDGLVMETMANRTGTRYRVEGHDIDGNNCRIVFIAVRRTGQSPSEERSRDLDLQLELVRRLEPEAAARIAQVTDERVHEPRNQPPVAVPTTGFVEGAVPLTVCFDATRSYHPQRKRFAVEWDFGDGRGTASSAQTCHEYVEPGLYAASVTVTDDEGLRDSRNVVVFVRDSGG